MRTPAQAFAWELWRKHRLRLIAIIAMFFVFALAYPKLCAVAGVVPERAMDDFAKNMAKVTLNGGPTLLQVSQILLWFFIVGGPATIMLLSLLCVTWMFTLLEFNPNAKDPMGFPKRIFTLPVSTNFLFWWMTLAGLASIVLLFQCWVLFVPLPREVFDEYKSCFGWMTFLVMAQGLAWTLAGWPITRFLALSAMITCFMSAPFWPKVFDYPEILPAFFLIGLVFARVGLQKMRHSQWKDWPGRWPLAGMLTSAKMRGPRRFASPAQAQLWFEWRRFARTLSFLTVALAVTSVLIHLLLRVALDLGPLQNQTLLGFTLCLLGLPVMLNVVSSLSPARNDHSFLMNRPLTGGDMTVALLKADAISTVISWLAVFAALSAMPLLGDFRWAERSICLVPAARLALVIGLIFMTWRAIAVNICFMRSGNRRLGELPALAIVAFGVAASSFGILKNQDSLSRFIPFIPGLLACLVAVKLLLAFIGFRGCIKRRILTPNGLRSYLAVWTGLVVALIATTFLMPHLRDGRMLPLTLFAILLVPLARISFAPIAFEHSRHASSI
jgi:hypothetical protein